MEPAASAKGKKLRDKAQRLPLTGLAVLEALLPAAERQTVRQFRAAIGGRGRRESDDEEALMQIGLGVRAGLTVKSAVRGIVNALPTAGSDINGDLSVVLAGRVMARKSAEKHLEGKFSKHEPEIMRRIAGAARARQMAEQYLRPALASLGKRVTFDLPSPRALRTMKLPVSRNIGDILADPSLPDQIDEIHRSMSKLIGQSRTRKG